MTQPSAPRPVPGPPRAGASAAEDAAGRDRFASLADRPVADHVEVFEAEHDRLQSELGTIDRV